MMELLKNIVTVGSDVRSTYYGISPSILIENIRVIGGV
jgi:predicted Zn-dependent protease